VGFSVLPQQIGLRQRFRAPGSDIAARDDRREARSEEAARGARLKSDGQPAACLSQSRKPSRWSTSTTRAPGSAEGHALRAGRGVLRKGTGTRPRGERAGDGQLGHLDGGVRDPPRGRRAPPLLGARAHELKDWDRDHGVTRSKTTV
jgi:hypothetical protein